ncbi:MAG: ribose-phosphate diphosphokinase [bacterium JZ-2024 1]
MPQGELKIFSGSGNPGLAQEICDYLGVSPGQREIIRFSNENIFVRILENVRGADVFLIQSFSSPVSEMVLELLIMLDAFWRASAGRITAVIPYFAYGRTDKKDQPRVPITAKLLADLIATAHANRVLTMDFHAEQIQGFFSIPVDQLVAAPVFAREFPFSHFSDVVCVAPDTGAAKRVRRFAEKLNFPFAIIDKRRIGNVDRSEIVNVVGDVQGKTALLLDDEIDTGGSVIQACDALLEKGAAQVIALATHAVFSGSAPQKLQNSSLSEVWVTNTLPLPHQKCFPKLRVLSVAPLFGEAIKSIHEETSITRLFEGF